MTVGVRDQIQELGAVAEVCTPSICKTTIVLFKFLSGFVYFYLLLGNVRCRFVNEVKKDNLTLSILLKGECYMV